MNEDIVETDATFDAAGVRYQAALTVPTEGTPTWAVVIVPGSFYNDIDGNYSMKDGNPFEANPNMYADVARQLAERGHAVLRYARAGTETIDEEKAAANTGFASRVDEVEAACQLTRTLVPDAAFCALAGHSEGSVVSLLVLTQDNRPAIDAFISLSGPAVRFFDVMIQQAEDQAVDGKFAMGPMEVPMDLYRRAIELVRAGDPVPYDIKNAVPFGPHTMDEEGKRYLREYDTALDPREAIAEVDCPVLLVQGGRDTSVPAQNGRQLMAARRARSARTDIAFFPELQHFYKRVPADAAPMETFNLETETDERVADAISAWLDGLKNRG